MFHGYRTGRILSSGAHERREEELLIEVQQLKDELGQFRYDERNVVGTLGVLFVKA